MLCTGLRGRAGRCGGDSRPSARSAAPVLAILLALLFVALQAAADIKSSTGNIFMDANNNGASEAVITTTGLGIGTLTPSANLHVMGNAYVSGSMGLGTTTPRHTMDINGTLSFSVQSVSSNTTLSSNTVVLATLSANTTLTLPAASSVTGRQYIIKKTSNSNTLTVESASGSIDGYSNLKLTSSGNGYPYATVASDGSAWYVLARSSDGVASAGDIPIFKDTFTRASGDLNGTAPETRPGSETWAADTSIDLDGSKVTLSTVFKVAYLPVGTLSSSKKYYLQATITVTPAANDDWLAIGFKTAAETSVAHLGDMKNWILVRAQDSGADDGQTFDDGTGNGQNHDISGYPKTVTLRIEYRGSDNNFRALIDGVEVRAWGTAYSLTSGNRYASMLGWGAAGSIDNFEFGEITN